MKICFLMPTHWSAGLGGSEVQVKQIMAYLRRSTPHQLSMICRRSMMSDEEGTPIYATTRAGRGSWRYLLGVDYLSVPRLLKTLAPDVVYARRGTPLLGFAARYCRRFRKRLVFHIAHVDDVTRPQNRNWRDFHTRIGRLFFEYGLRRADVIIAQAQYQPALLREHYGLVATCVVPNVHPVPAVSAKPALPRTVVWVANLKSAKRPELYVDLARHFASSRDIRFLMAGASQDSRYGQMIRGDALPENVQHLGQLQLEEVNRLLDSAHIFVNTSRPDGEGFPNTFIQAWLRQVPVVSLEVDPDGLLSQHQIGHFCAGSVVEMARAVQRLLQDERRRQSMGRAAREFAVATFGEQNFERLSALLAIE